MLLVSSIYIREISSLSYELQIFPIVFFQLSFDFTCRIFCFVLVLLDKSIFKIIVFISFVWFLDFLLKFHGLFCIYIFAAYPTAQCGFLLLFS